MDGVERMSGVFHLYHLLTDLNVIKPVRPHHCVCTLGCGMSTFPFKPFCFWTKNMYITDPTRNYCCFFSTIISFSCFSVFTDFYCYSSCDKSVWITNRWRFFSNRYPQPQPQPRLSSCANFLLKKFLNCSWSCGQWEDHRCPIPQKQKMR